MNETTGDTALAGQNDPIVRLPHRMHFLGPHDALCPFCNGKGVEPLAATTYISVCKHCKGRGKVFTI
jgi:RecJ-like exonuclease